jgi:hypothetical protein
MLRKSDKITHSFYEAAPDMLLDKIAEVNGILSKQKANSGMTEPYKFWTGVSDVMKFAWDYFQDFRWIIRKNEMLELENRFLKEWGLELSRRLETYEVIRETKLNGRFEEAVKRVDDYILKNDQLTETSNENKPND